MVSVAHSRTAERLRLTPRPAGTWWLIQVATGALLLVMLGLHMVAQHFVVAGGLRDFRDVLSYIGNPVIIALELVFLIGVVAHGLVGVRAILVDLGPSPRRVRLIERALATLGIATIAYGVWLAAMLQRLR